MGAKPKTDRAATKPSNDALRAVFAGAVAKPAAKGDKGLKGGSQASTSGTSAGAGPSTASGQQKRKSEGGDRAAAAVAAAGVDGAGAGGGKKGKKGSAIDDIFASTKKEKAAAAVKEQEERREAEELEAMKSVHPAAFENLSRAGRARTDDGLFIYSDKEMNVGLGKDTKDCPFDCWCCY